MKEKNPPHRPKGTTISIDWKRVDAMCAIQCTGQEIADVLGFSYNTLVRACEREQGVLFEEYFAQKRSSGKSSLRRKQYSIAMNGNPTMLVWLGKNWLGQTDKSEIALDHNITAFEVVADED